MRSSIPGVFVAVAVISLALSGCSPKQTTPGVTTDGAIEVTANETDCTATRATATTGEVTFQVANRGQTVTEFYVYATGDRVLGEVENIAPGQSRQLIVAMTEPGSYEVLCRPGMTGAGIRHSFMVTGDIAHAPDASPLTAAVEGYKRHLVSQIDALPDTASTFVAAVKAGDVVSAKHQYPVLRTYYERVEPVAESFPNNLDRRLDLREADLMPGDAWTGFHRLEKDLWATGLQPDTNRVADQLLTDIDELATGVKAPSFVVDALHIAGGAQTLLDEIARTKITGEEDVFSHTDLWDFQANIDGSKAAVASVRAVLDARRPDLGKQIDERFADVDNELAQYRRGNGFVSYDAVDQTHRTILSRRIDALSAVVSQVQSAIAE